MAAAAARSALLKHLRVQLRILPRDSVSSFALSLNNLFARRFASDQARGSFLDKSEVRDRVISVVKNFQKVDPAKLIDPS